MALSGYIKIHRKMLNWGWYDEPNVVAVFLHLLLISNYKTTEWRGIKILPGQCIIGRKALAKTLKLSEQQIRTALDKLESTHEINRKTTNKFTVVTIENWAKYQLDENENNQQITNKQPTNNQQITTPKESKEIKNIVLDETPKEKIPLRKKIPPSIEDIKTYCLERKNGIDAEKFFNYYEATNWYRGKDKIKDWQACVRNWELNEKPKKEKKADGWKV